VTRGPRLDNTLAESHQVLNMVGITICIVIRSQMDIVACLLAPWSGGKDPDRYLVVSKGMTSLMSHQ
jgi:hypothetical protein